MTANNNTVSIETVQNFCDKINAKYPQAMRVWFVKPGKRYHAIMTHTKAQDGIILLNTDSAYGFVDTTNGDFLKAASWKAPAKGSRGNLLTSLGTALHNAGEYGVAHLR